MLSDDDKRRIQAEEQYRAQVRNQQAPVKTEGFTDKLNRFRMWFGIIVAVLFIAFMMMLQK
ncbi:MAG: hypothetical protein ABL901_03790 [Hyphomicrobiaceae bacterium]